MSLIDAPFEETDRIRSCANCESARPAPPRLAGSYGGRPPGRSEPTVSCLWLGTHRHDLAFAMVANSLSWLGKGVGWGGPDAMVVRANDVCAMFEPR